MGRPTHERYTHDTRNLSTVWVSRAASATRREVYITAVHDSKVNKARAAGPRGNWIEDLLLTANLEAFLLVRCLALGFASRKVSAPQRSAPASERRFSGGCPGLLSAFMSSRPTERPRLFLERRVLGYGLPSVSGRISSASRSHTISRRAGALKTVLACRPYVPC